MSSIKKAFSKRHYLAAALLATLFLPGLPRAASGAGVAKPAAAPPSAPTAKGSLTSILIVAQNAVSDPNFGGSIVVVMNNLGPAPVGIIVNRPMPLPVARLFPKRKRLARVHARVYYGGPVEFGTLWYLFRAATAPAHTISYRVCDGVYVSSDQKLLAKLLDRPEPMHGLRLFIGHAGWAPGQLQAEIQGGAWLPRQADANSIFNAKPELPWPSPHQQKPGT